MTPPWSDAFAENNHLSFNSCPRTAKRGSISGRHEHAPSFRFLPQWGQMPLQSGLQSSFESMFSTNAVVRISSRSAISPSCRRKVHSSASSSRSSERVSTACTGQETRRSNGAAQRSQTACRFVRSRPLKRGHRRCCAPCRAKGPARLQACSCRKQDRTDLRSSRTEGLRRA